MDDAYSAILGFLPSGLKGLAIAALTAAIVASLAGKLNSIATIFTLDIYMKYFKKKEVSSEGSKKYGMDWKTGSVGLYYTGCSF